MVLAAIFDMTLDFWLVSAEETDLIDSHPSLFLTYAVLTENGERKLLQPLLLVVALSPPPEHHMYLNYLQ